MNPQNQTPDLPPAPDLGAKRGDARRPRAHLRVEMPLVAGLRHVVDVLAARHQPRVHIRHLALHELRAAGDTVTPEGKIIFCASTGDHPLPRLPHRNQANEKTRSAGGPASSQVSQPAVTCHPPTARPLAFSHITTSRSPSTSSTPRPPTTQLLVFSFLKKTSKRTKLIPSLPHLEVANFLSKCFSYM